MKKYVTTVSTDGDVYCEIAEILTIMGYPMNHCTARNVVITVMEKIVRKLSKQHNVKLPPQKVREIAQSPEFQSAVVTIFDQIELVNQ